MASANGAIFFEVSAAINHLVDELLVDMVVQWRKRIARHEFTSMGLSVQSTRNSSDTSETGFVSEGHGRQSWTSTLNSPKNMLQRLFKQQFTAKSCMDLQKS